MRAANGVRRDLRRDLRRSLDRPRLLGTRDPVRIGGISLTRRRLAQCAWCRQHMSSGPEVAAEPGEPPMTYVRRPELEGARLPARPPR
jgi:hypothetical protein